VAGDPLSVDAVITEVTALAKTHLNFEIVPVCPTPRQCPRMRACHWDRRTPLRMSAVTWTGRHWLPHHGPLILHATASHLPDAARTLIEYGLADTTPTVLPRNGTDVPAAFGGDHAGRSCSTRAFWRAASPPVHWRVPLVVTIARPSSIARS